MTQNDDMNSEIVTLFSQRTEAFGAIRVEMWPEGLVIWVGGLAQMIMNNAARAGFLKLGDDGKPVGTGIDGCDGYLLWCAVNKPEHYMALMARILPYYVNTNEPVGPTTVSREEMLAQLRERGLPLELIEHLRKAPEILDPGEQEDPYGLLNDVTPETDDTGK